VRILHVAKKYPPLIGGDATAVDALRRAQERAGHEVAVVVSNAPEIPAAAGVHKVGPPQTGADLDRITRNRVRTMRALRRWCRVELPRLRPDVVHSHSADLGYPAAAEARRVGIPSVQTCHGLWFPVWGPWSLRGRAEIALLRRARHAAIATVDRPALEALRARGFSRVVHIANGVDVEEFAGPRTEPDPPRLLFAGRHELQKGLDVLLDAVAIVRRDRGAGFRLVIAGQGSQTPVLRERSRALGLDGVVSFAGALPRGDLVRAVREASALVLPSRFEGFPIAILEAWAVGVPVIATSVGGVADLCGPENAVLVPAEDPRALATAIAVLLDDPALRRRLGGAGHRLVRERYTWDAVAGRYIQLYDEVRAPSRSAPP